MGAVPIRLHVIAVRSAFFDRVLDPVGLSAWLLRRHPSGTMTMKNVSNQEIVVVLLFYVHGKHLRSCRDGQLT